MTERVLIISGDANWQDALLISMELAGFDAMPRGSSGRWLELARAFKATSAVIHAERPGADVEDDLSLDQIDSIIAEIRISFPFMRVAIVTAVPDERLRRFSIGNNIVELLFDIDGDPSNIVKLFAEAMSRINSFNVTEPNEPYATIEITLGQAHLICEARVGTEVENFGPETWNRRDLVRMNANFRSVEVDDRSFLEMINHRSLVDVSQILLWHAFERPLALGRDFCEKYFPNGKVCYRFTVGDGDLEFVPFELVATANEGEYLRSVRPLARRLDVKQTHSDPDAPRIERRPGAPRVLFILSEAEGSLSINNHSFRGQEAMALGKLEHTIREKEQIATYYGLANVKVVDLLPGADAFAQLREAFTGALYDIIHFAGHSVRSDNNEDVFLILPGKQEGEVLGYNVEDFARRAAEVNARLVILSSCEGASCRTLSRMAAFGIPAVVGFRWKIDDRDAAVFTPALHRALGNAAGAVPIVQAFHSALQELKDPSEERVSWFSPVLMLQRTVWHNYTTEQ